MLSRSLSSPHRPRRRRVSSVSRNGPGFTLVEAMLTLVLIGLVAAVAIPRIDFAGWRLNAAAREVGGFLRKARQTAIRHEHDVIVSFDTTASHIVIHENRDSDAAGEVGGVERVYRRHLPEDVRFGPSGAPPVRGRQGWPSSFESSTVVFHANGAASESGVVYLTSVSEAEQLRKIRALWIDRATGSVKLFRLRASGWEAF